MVLTLLSDPGFWIVQALNSLQYAMLLFLLSVGLTVVFGLMNFVNLAHGALYAVGAYAAITIAGWTGSYWIGFLAAPLVVALVGAVIYVALIDRLRRAGPLNQVLATFGLLFVAMDIMRYVWTADHVGLPADVVAPLPGSVAVLGEPYPVYRLFIIGLGAAMYGALYYGLERTRLGSEVRAGVDDPEMAAALGVDVRRTFFGVFLLGCALAGLAGAVAAPVFAAAPPMAVEILIPALAVIVIGGLGSLNGALLGALGIGTAVTFCTALAPGFAAILVYALLAAVLVFRPEGLRARLGSG